MEAAAALLLALVGGYLFTHEFYLTRYKAAREDGHRLYFRAAFLGSLLLVASLFIVAATAWLGPLVPGYSAINGFVLEHIGELLFKPTDNIHAQFNFAIACLLAMLLGNPAARFLNWVFAGRRDKALWEAISKDELEDMLMRALVLAKPVQITMSNAKVYVGFVSRTPEPHTVRKQVTLVPLMSGYRNVEGKVTFTTFYDRLYAKLGDDFDEDDFRIVLPIDKCLSFALFDIQTYARFQERDEDEASKDSEISIDASSPASPRL